MKCAMFFIVGVMCFSSVAGAGDSSKEELVAEFIVVTKVKEKHEFAYAVDEEDEDVSLTEEQKRKISQLMDRVMAWENVKDQYAQTFRDVYDEEELRALIGFYKTPRGQRLIDREIAIETELVDILEGEEQDIDIEGLEGVKAEAIERYFQARKIRERYEMELQIGLGFGFELWEGATEGGDLPEFVKSSVSEQVPDLMKQLLEQLGWPNVKDDYLRLFDKYYSLEELNILSEFYESPAAAGAVDKEAGVAGRKAQITSELFKEVQPELFKIIMDEKPIKHVDPQAEAERIANLSQAGRYIAGWADNGMYVPERQEVQYFKANFEATRDELIGALSHPNEEIRDDVVYVIGRIGPAAQDTEKELLARLKIESEQDVQMALVDALAAIGAKDDVTIETLRRLYDSLGVTNVPPHSPYRYAEVDEKINLAGALYNLSEGAAQMEYFNFVTRWLKGPPAELKGDLLEGYWERRWIAVNSLGQMPGAFEAIEMLEAMQDEEDAKPWVKHHGPRVIEFLRQGGR